MYSLIQQTEAILDAQETYNWYEDIRSGLGIEFLNEIEAALNKISLHPYNYSFTSKNLRKIRIRRFPYLILNHIQHY
jgi:hypothetical protein